MKAKKRGIRQCTRRSLYAIAQVSMIACTFCVAATSPTPVFATTNQSVASKGDIAPQGKWQSIASIRSAALAHAKRSQPASGIRTESRIKALDSRLRLVRCTQKLETFAASNAAPSATQIVGVRCSGSKPWKVFVQVSTLVYKPVVVANRPLRKGASITADDVRLEERDITRLGNRYLTDLSQLDGHILKRDVPDQAVLSEQTLDVQNIIKRGQSITLMAGHSSLSVRMRGEALDSAAKNERVRVKNLSSNRVVEGVVLSNQVVLVEH